MKSNTFGTFDGKQESTRIQPPGAMVTDSANMSRLPETSAMLFKRKISLGTVVHTHRQLLGKLRQEDFLSLVILGCSELCPSGIHAKFGINMLTSQGHGPPVCLRHTEPVQGQKRKPSKLSSITELYSS